MHIAFNLEGFCRWRPFLRHSPMRVVSFLGIAVTDHWCLICLPAVLTGRRAHKANERKRIELEARKLKKAENSRKTTGFFWW